MKPFLRWAGGKQALSHEITSRFPKFFGAYYEPFMGSAAVFFSMPERSCATYLSDANEDLVRTFIAVRDRVEDVIDILSELACTEKEYYRIRDEWRGLNQIGSAARFIYLNRTCFNGLYRMNKDGRFNTPWGKKLRGTDIVRSENLRAASQRLSRVDFMCSDAIIASCESSAGDLIYFDPPYHGTFAGYTKQGFGELEQAALANTATILGRQGVHVIVSNSDTPLIRDLYAGHKIERITRNGRMNSKGSARQRVSELLITINTGV